MASNVSAVSSIKNNNSYILKNNYASIFISKKDNNITLFKIASDNKEFLNRSYIETNNNISWQYFFSLILDDYWIFYIYIHYFFYLKLF